VATLSGSWAPLVTRDVGYAEMARENWNKAYLTVQEANAVTTAATKVFFGAQKKRHDPFCGVAGYPYPTDGRGEVNYGPIE
jgi:hypothetical protein